MKTAEFDTEMQNPNRYPKLATFLRNGDQKWLHLQEKLLQPVFVRSIITNTFTHPLLISLFTRRLIFKFSRTKLTYPSCDPKSGMCHQCS